MKQSLIFSSAVFGFRGFGVSGLGQLKSGGRC